LEETGPTALGPALVACLGICSTRPGSKIVVCTDGLSNKGLGSLDEMHTDEEKEEGFKFYEGIGLYGQAKGINISVISIIGSDCSLENLGKLSELTAGGVDRVDPTMITKNFQSILSLPLIATHVRATMQMHKGLYIRLDDLHESEKSSDVREVGNVTSETGVTFEYGVRANYKKDDFNKLTHLPFQIQIEYTRLDGMKCLRVISKKQVVTFDRKEAEDKANIAVLATNAVHQSAKMASKGDYLQARFYNMSNKVMMDRASNNVEQRQQYNLWTGHGKKFESEMAQVQRSEVEQGLDLDDEEEDFHVEINNDVDQSNSSESKPAPNVKPLMKKKQEQSRKNARTDVTSNMLYQMKAAPQSFFK